VNIIVGSDDTGSGALGGPLVITSAVIDGDLSEDIKLLGSGDSKKISPNSRRNIIRRLQYRPDLIFDIFYAVCEASDIDQYGLRRCQQSCLSKLILSVLENYPLLSEIQLDSGLDGDWLESFSNSDIKISVAQKDGEKLYPSVGVASIYGKEYRDYLMNQLGETYPPYGLSKNKGYGTAEHSDALKRFGPIPGFHRQNYIVSMLGEEYRKFWN
jgi:ribonuclease HII